MPCSTRTRPTGAASSPPTWTSGTSAAAAGPNGCSLRAPWTTPTTCSTQRWSFQHGADRSHFLRAHELAKRAAELGATRPARWLAAAAYDRWLMTGGLPQKYGTQYRFANGRWVLHEVDPATSDEERVRWDVPPLAEALRRADQMTRDPGPRPLRRDG